MAAPTKTARSRRTRAALTAAVHHRLCAQGGFTPEEVAADAGCTVGTFWAHFESKDDAVTAAFDRALTDLVELVEEIFGSGPSGFAGPIDPQQWAAGTVDRLIEYFVERSLLYRLAIARLPEHRPLREVYRAAERSTIELAEAALGGAERREDAEVMISFCQGLNNPLVLRSSPGDRMRRQMTAVCALLVRPHPAEGSDRSV